MEGAKEEWRRGGGVAGVCVVVGWVGVAREREKKVSGFE